MAEYKLDEFYSVVGFREDSRALTTSERKFERYEKRIRQIGRGVQIGMTAALGLGAAASAVGMPYEKSLVRLRTQLGLTAEDAERADEVITALSGRTGQNLDRIAEAYFNIRSAAPGIAEADAFDILAAATNAATIGLGDVNTLALAGTVAMSQYGSEVVSGTQAMDVFHQVIRQGVIPDTAAMASGMGLVLGPAAQLGVSLEEVGAIIAAYSQTGAPITQVMTSLRTMLLQLMAAGPEARKALQTVYTDAEDVQEALRADIRERGLITVLQHLRANLDDLSVRRVVAELTAMSVVLDMTGDRAVAYADALEWTNNAQGSVTEGLQLYKDTGAFAAEVATNELKIAMVDLYQNAVSPLLVQFGKLPSVIQTTIVGLGVAAAASTLLGHSFVGTAMVGGFRFLVSLRQLNAATIRQNIALGVLQLQLWGLTISQFAATAAQWALNAAMWANPVGIIVLGVLALVGAYLLLRDEINGLIKDWTGLEELSLDSLFFEPILGTTLAQTKEDIEEIKTALSDFGEWFSSGRVWGDLLGWILSPFTTAFQNIKDGIDELIEYYNSLARLIPGLEEITWRADPAASMTDQFLAISQVNQEEVDAAINAATRRPNRLLEILSGALPGGSLAYQAIRKWGLPEGAEGGLVTGPPGAPVPAVVHSGEIILPTPVARLFTALAEGPQAFAPAIPPPAPALAGGSQIVIGDINVSVTVQGGGDVDAREVAQTSASAIRDEIINAAEDLIGRIAR